LGVDFMMYASAIAVLCAIGGILAIALLIADRFLCNYGPCQIRVNDEEPFTVKGGGKLLDALYDQRIFIPSACGGQGTCGFCKVCVQSGGGPTLPTELPFLSPDEVTSNTRLACQVKVKQDLVLKVKEEFLNVKEFITTVKSARLVTSDTREIVLSLAEGESMDFRPGQYVQIFVPGQKETVFRAYSIASPPSRKNEIELLIRLIPGGIGSGYMHTVEEGDQVRLTGPYGEFILDESSNTELICVGGGCGMAPMRSLLRHVTEATPNKVCRLFFGARTTQDAMYFDEFQELAKTNPNLKITYALSEPEKSPEWDGETGFIHESVDRHLGLEGHRQAFLCGPPLMIEATMKVLAAKGIPKEEAFYDEF
jgi:Na+-transporting NADH:ubiquinone oxidoreductase subunit F